MGKDPKKWEGWRQGGNYYQGGSSSSSGENPFQGLDNYTHHQLQNLHHQFSSASPTQLTMLRGPLARESNYGAPRGNIDQARARFGQSSVLLPYRMAEVSPPFPILESNPIPFQRPSSLFHPQVPTREIEENRVVVPSNYYSQVNVGLSSTKPESKERVENPDGQGSTVNPYTPNVPVILSSGYSSYTLEDSELGEGSSSGVRRVSCRKRAMNGIAPFGWLTLGQSSRAASAALIRAATFHIRRPDQPVVSNPYLGINLGPSRNIRPRSNESNMEQHLQLAQDNHHPMHNSNNHFVNVLGSSPVGHQRPRFPPRYDLLPASSNATNFNYYPWGMTSPGIEDFVAGSRPVFGDCFPKLDAGLDFVGLPDPMTNSGFQFPQGNWVNQFIPRMPGMFNVLHQNYNSSFDLNALTMSAISSSSTRGAAASGNPQGPAEKDDASTSFLAAVSTHSNVGVMIREVGASPPSSSRAGGGANLEAGSSSTSVVPAQETSGEPNSEDTAGIGSPMVNGPQEEASDDEEAEEDEDEFEDLRFDVDEMTYEELVELQEEIGNVSHGLSAEVIQTRLKRATYANAEVSPTHKQEICPICWEDYIEGDDMGKLDCGHGYHFRCLKKWLQIKNSCPICKDIALAEI